MIKRTNFSSCQRSSERVQHHRQLHQPLPASSVCVERVCAIIIIALLSIFTSFEPVTHPCVGGICLQGALDNSAEHAGDFSGRIKAVRQAEDGGDGRSCVRALRVAQQRLHRLLGRCSSRTQPGLSSI